MKLSISAITLFSLITAFGAKAEQPLPFGATDAEYRLLPPYCLAKDKGDYTPWISYFGGRENAVHMHHYCDCLRFQNRALQSRTRNERGFNYKNAVEGCEYVLKEARPDFFMRAEILTQKAKALMGMGDEVQAASSLNTAIEFNAKYAPAYVALADYFAMRKNEKLALEYLERGLANAPENKMLRKRYTELGGKNPLPELPTSPEPTSVTAPPQETKESDPLSPAEIRSKREAPSVEEITPNKPTAETAAEAATVQPKIGTSRNPWCRFCIEEDSPSNPQPATPAAAPTNLQ